MKNCIVCSKPFEPKNDKGVFCSGACKMKAARLKAKLAGDPTEEAPEEPAKEIPANTPIRNGELCNIEFSAFLKGFHTFWEKGQTKNIADLRDRAANNNIMNLRQKEAILARCDNVTNGTYGNTKRPEHLKHSGLLTSKP